MSGGRGGFHVVRLVLGVFWLRFFSWIVLIIFFIFSLLRVFAWSFKFLSAVVGQVAFLSTKAAGDFRAFSTRVVDGMAVRVDSSLIVVNYTALLAINA